MTPKLYEYLNPAAPVPPRIRRTINFYGGPETFDKGARLTEQVVSLLRANGFEVTWSIGGAE